MLAVLSLYIHTGWCLLAILLAQDTVDAAAAAASTLVLLPYSCRAVLKHAQDMLSGACLKGLHSWRNISATLLLLPPAAGVSCPYPPSTQPGFVWSNCSSGTATPNQLCVGACALGYTASGAISALCQPNGRHLVQGTCTELRELPADPYCKL
jgi:hypothetical protein